MSIGVLTILLFAAMLIIFASGLPVGLGLGFASMVFGPITMGERSFNLIGLTAYSTITNFLLLAIPLFIFMGHILHHSGLGEALFHAMYIFAGKVKGGLAAGVIVVCSILGAMVGIIGAGIMTSGTIALPEMLRKKYDKHLALGTVMAGGGMGILIPPSVPMILFASVTQTSVGRLFAGGVIPGIIMAASFISYILIRCTLNPKMGPAAAEKRKIAQKEKLIALRDSFFGFGLIFAILGSIVFGYATPTEAAAVGTGGAVLIACVYKKFNLSVLKISSIKAMEITSLVVWIVMGAAIFTNFHMFMGAARLVKGLVGQFGLSPWGVMIMMQISLFLLGFVMDEVVMVLVCSPLYTPIAVSLGFDPIWFGILMILNIELAIQTPPYGFALFYLKGVSPPNTTMMDIYKSTLPFTLIKMGNLVLCMAFPGLVTWLPNILFN